MDELDPTELLNQAECETTASRGSVRVAQKARSGHDGSGYPDKLVGKTVSLPSRIVAAADVYSALWERRSYKPSMPHEEVIRRLCEGDDRMKPEMFDPDVLAALRSAQPTIKRLLPD